MDRVTREWDEAMARWVDPYETSASAMVRLSTRPPVTLIQKRVGTLVGKRVIELGCGGGSLGLACAIRGAHATLFDNSAPVLESAKLNLERARPHIPGGVEVQLEQGDLLERDFGHAFDVCLSDGLIEHWFEAAERATVLEKHLNATASGGLVAVCIPNNAHPWMDRWERLGWPWTAEDCPLREAKITPDELACELSAVGLRDVQVQGYMVWDTLCKWPKSRTTGLLVKGLKATLGYDRVGPIKLSEEYKRRYGTWLLGTGFARG